MYTFVEVKECVCELVFVFLHVSQAAQNLASATINVEEQEQV